MCTNKCVVNVIIEDGKITGQEYVHKEIKKASAQKWTSIVASCARARGIAELMDHPDRINYPLRRVGERGENKWQRVTWKEALDDIASRLARVRDDYGALRNIVLAFRTSSAAPIMPGRRRYVTVWRRLSVLCMWEGLCTSTSLTALLVALCFWDVTPPVLRDMSGSRSWIC
jgi:anaerobic selenocysteine-containing dehydrogenase